MRWYLIRYEFYELAGILSETKLETHKNKKKAMNAVIEFTKNDSVKISNILMLYFDPTHVSDKPEVTELELVIRKGSFDLVEKTTEK